MSGSTDNIANKMLGNRETRYFFELTPDRILTAVETLGVRCTGRSFALNSMENRVYEVEIEPEDTGRLAGAGRFLIVKFYRPGRWTAEQIREEHRFLLDLQEYEIPVVAPLADPTGETLFETEGINIYFSVFPKIGGRSPDELTDAQLAQVGRLIGRIHNVGATRPAIHRLRMTPEQFLEGSVEVLEQCPLIPAELAQPLFDLIERLSAEISPLFEGVATQRIHGDCHLRNLLWGRDGAFVVDFDDMVMGPPVQDLWLLIPGRDADSARQLRSLLEGYEQMRPFDRQTLRLIEPLRTMRMVHFSAWIAKRWEDPAFPAAFPDFGTPQYWREQLATLREQQDMIRGGWSEEAPSKDDDEEEYVDEWKRWETD